MNPPKPLLLHVGLAEQGPLGDIELRFQIDVVQELGEQVLAGVGKVHVRRAVGSVAADIDAPQLTLALLNPSVKLPRRNGKSGISAACAPLTAPHITATSNNRRIATLHQHTLNLR